jgi:signal peptidase
MSRARPTGWWAAASVVGVVSVAVPLATFLVAAWLMGWQLLAVESGSMEPTYPIGSLLVVAPADASWVRDGMPIVFDDPTIDGRLVAHRVVGRAPGEALQFWTQGDANAVRDPFPVPARLVRGHVLWAVPMIGRVVRLARSPSVFLLLVVAPAIAAGVGERWRRMGRDHRRSEERGRDQPRLSHGSTADGSSHLKSHQVVIHGMPALPRVLQENAGQEAGAKEGAVCGL